MEVEVDDDELEDELLDELLLEDVEVEVDVDVLVVVVVGIAFNNESPVYAPADRGIADQSRRISV